MLDGDGGSDGRASAFGVGSGGERRAQATAAAGEGVQSLLEYRHHCTLWLRYCGDYHATNSQGIGSDLDHYNDDGPPW